MQMIACQPELSPALRVVVGNVDYSEFKRTLERIDRILALSGIEADFVGRRVDAYEQDVVAYARRMGEQPRKIGLKERGNVQEHAVRALRCNVVRELTGESARGLSIRLADSELLQWFCRIDRVDVIRVPSKSTLDRYEKLVSETLVRTVVDRLNGVATSTGNDEIDVARGKSVPDDALIHFWRVASPGCGPVKGCSMERFLREGYEVVNSFYPETYIDNYIHEEKLAKWHPASRPSAPAALRPRITDKTRLPPGGRADRAGNPAGADR